MIHPRFEKARAEADGPLPDGPFRGVPLVLKDLALYSEGDPYHAGTRLLRSLGYTADHDSYLDAEVPRRRLRRRRPDQRARAGHHHHHRVAGLGPGPQPVGPRLLDRGLVGRLGGGGGGRLRAPSVTPTTAVAPSASRPPTAGWSG